jgi:hypothetical protein
MRLTSRWNILGVGFLVGLLAVSAVPLQAVAQQPGPLTAQQFQANPSQVLANYSGPELIALIRQLALADQADLPLIIGLLANASTDQANAIGTGLGQAAMASVATDQAYAYQIQQNLAAANNSTASLAFAAVTGNQAIGAAGGGGGGGGGGAGGGGGGTVGTSGATGGFFAGGGTANFSTSTTNTPTNFFTLSFSSSAGSSSSNSTTTTTTQSVSPH